MKFAIITHVEHIKQNNCYFAYSPYVREMNIWGNYADQLHIVAPLAQDSLSAIHLPYQHQNITFQEVETFSLTSFKNSIKALIAIPKISWRIFKAMQQADHIHLRCPGNIGLLGAIVQTAFPNKPKTAKYAGNWDPASKQPWSYKLQKWILSNTLITRNMQVLVYGEWEGSTKNIKPFFTATYRESEKIMSVLRRIDKREIGGEGDLEKGDLEKGDLEKGDLEKGDLEKGRLGDEERGGRGDIEKRVIRFLFVGTLSKGKRPLYTVQLAEQLHIAGYGVHLDLYGEGAERHALEAYIQQKGLQGILTLHGNQTAATVQTAYENSHFLVLPSQSEGWPKVVAEAMFWGCVPIASAVSCVPNMLGHGERGIILTMDLEKDIQQIKTTLDNEALYQFKAANAVLWSRQYTLDYFEEEIRLLLRS